jgi:hypothetical protein
MSLVLSKMDKNEVGSVSSSKTSSRRSSVEVM